MSGIAGLVRFDGRSVTSRELERTANALNQYGPDRVEIVAKENIGLVHALMRMTPEDRFDSQPQRGASGSIITADLRLDNRDELLERIGIARLEATKWPDSRLLLTAWEKLGNDVWPILRGPFAVAIWDPRRRSLTLARDHLGLNVVMWHKTRTFFCLCEHAEWPFRTGWRAARIVRGEVRRFSGAQSRRPRDNNVPERVSRSSGACHPSKIRRVNKSAPLLVACRHQAGQASLRRSLCRRIARVPRSCGAPANA